MTEIFDEDECTDNSGVWSEALEVSERLSALENQEEFTQQRYGFLIGDTGFLLEKETLAEVAVDVAVHPMPHTAKWFAGMINMRGNLVPVFDLKMLFGFENQIVGKDKRRMLVFGSDDKVVSILIDKLPMTVNLEQPIDQAPDLPEVIKNHVGDVYSDKGRIWVEYDADNFFKHIGEMASVG